MWMKVKQSGEKGTSLAVQLLRLCALNAGGMGSIPGGELRSHRQHGVAKKTPENKQTKKTKW